MKHTRRYSGQKKQWYQKRPAAKINGQWVSLSDLAWYREEMWEVTRKELKERSNEKPNTVGADKEN